LISCTRYQRPSWSTSWWVAALGADLGQRLARITRPGGARESRLFGCHYAPAGDDL
jgi:hypothetical protein